MRHEKIPPVGYCNPPQHTRWKKGQSGNPKGRRPGKKTKSTYELVTENLGRQIPYREDGVEKVGTVLGIIFRQLSKKVATGSISAQRLLDRFEKTVKPIPEIYLITEEDRRFAAELYADRLRRSGPGNGNSGDEQ